MKKIHVDGINGYIEANNKYVFVVLGRKDASLLKEHVVLYDEIEDIIYKKPTREKFGFITLYLSTKSYVTNRKIKYSLILDKIDQKNLESNKKIYDFIKNIIKNKDIKVQEIVEETEKEEKKEEKENIIEENHFTLIERTNKDEEKDNNIVIEIGEPIKEVKSQVIIDNQIDNIEEPKKEDYKIPIEIKETKETKTIDSILEVDKKEEEYIKEINKDLDNGFEVIKIDTKELIEEEIEEDIEEEKELDEEVQESIEEEKELVKETQFKTIDKLEVKIKEIEKELNKLSYKVLILNNYVDETKDRKTLEKNIIELNKILEKLEKLKKEIYKQEKNISENDIIKIEDGNVIITGIGRLSLDDKNKEVEKYLDYYKSVINKIDDIEKETDETSKEAEYKRVQLKITEKEYEESINSFKNVKSNKDFINKYLKETKEDLKKVKKKIERTVNPKVKYKFVKRSISEQTKRLAALQALNSLRPNRSRFSIKAVSFLTGVSSIGDLLGYDLKKVEYNEVIIKEMIVGLDSLDTSKARFLIDTSKDQIDSILRDCNRMYLDYPKYKELRKDLLSIKADIEKEDLELKMMEDQISEYKRDSKVKILKYQE